MAIPTGERLTRVEQKVDDLKDDVGDVKRTLDAFIKSADDKYASKLAERIIYVMAGTILLAVLYVVLSSIGLNFTKDTTSHSSSSSSTVNLRGNTPSTASTPASTIVVAPATPQTATEAQPVSQAQSPQPQSSPPQQSLLQQLQNSL